MERDSVVKVLLLFFMVKQLLAVILSLLAHLQILECSIWMNFLIILFRLLKKVFSPALALL